MNKVKFLVLSLCSFVVLSSCDFLERNKPLVNEVGRALVDEIENSQRSGGVADAASAPVAGGDELLSQDTPDGVPEQMLRRAGYTASYNKTTKLPNWVAWHLTADRTTGPAKRSGVDFQADMDVPAPRAEDSDYYGSGYDRGHMLPQATRYNNYETNRMTYYATNMMPQNSRLNQGIWASLEGKVRGWGPLPNGTRYDTLYVVTGASFKDPGATISNANGPITVPTHCWKVLLKQKGNLNKQLWELEADEVKAIGFIFTNDAAGAGTSLLEAACTVGEVEQLTGFEFFPMLDPAVAGQVKNRLNTAEWSGIY